MLSLERIDLVERQIAELNAQIGVLVEPFGPQIAPLDSIPGVEVTAARDILGEMGRDMSQFGSAARVASWAKSSPGNNASAGKRRRAAREREAVFAADLGAMCVDRPQNFDVAGAHFPTARSAPWGQACRGGRGA